MNEINTSQNINPITKANVFSKLTYMWCIKIFYHISKHGIYFKDLFKVLENYESKTLGSLLESKWYKEVENAKENNRNPSFKKVMRETFIMPRYYYCFILFIEWMLRAFQPIVLGYLVIMISVTHDTGKHSQLKISVVTALLLINLVLKVFFNHTLEYAQLNVGNKMRIALRSLLYRKLLRVKKCYITLTETHNVIENISEHASSLNLIVFAWNVIIVSPFIIVVMLIFAYIEIGLSAGVGVGLFVILIIPYQLILIRKALTVHKNISRITTMRLKLISEILAAMKLIKIQSLEKPMERMVNEFRKREIFMLKQFANLKGLGFDSVEFMHRTAVYGTVVVYMFLQNAITVDILFAVFLIFIEMQLILVVYLPVGITNASTCSSVYKEMERFLLLADRDLSKIEYTHNETIVLENVVAAWLKTPVLHIDYMEITKGQLCAFTGQTNCGRSSLMQLLLGELPATSGRVQVGGKISFCSQVPFLCTTSIRSNIVLESNVNKQHYLKVKQACFLIEEFEKFSDGDLTIVNSEKLSHLQEVKINLARTLYNISDIYLFDESLTDIKVSKGNELFDEIMIKFLTGKTRVIVTNQSEYLRKVDVIFLLKEGKLLAKGTYAELLTNAHFRSILMIEENIMHGKKHSVSPDNVVSFMSTTLQQKNLTFRPKITLVADPEFDSNFKNGPKTQSIFIRYLMSGGILNMMLLAALFGILVQCISLFSDYLITYWAVGSTEYQINKNCSCVDYLFPIKSDNYNVTMHMSGYGIKLRGFILLYTTFIALTIITNITRTFMFLAVSFRASEKLHTKMLRNMLYAPIRFYQKNAFESILTRFSSDISVLDHEFPIRTMESVQVCIVTAGILVLTIISEYYLAVAVVIQLALYYMLTKWYFKTSKAVMVLEEEAKFLWFSKVQSTIRGISTIRAANAESALIEQFDQSHDVHSSCWHLVVCIMEAFGLWFDLICVIFIGLVVISQVFSIKILQHVGPSIGLALTHVLCLTGLVEYGMRQIIGFAHQMTNVENVLEFSNLKNELNYECPYDKRINQNWGQKGIVKVKELYLKYYHEKAYALTGINFIAHSGEKVAIIGEVSSGKHSLVSAIMRMVNYKGLIEIDGIDISKVGLKLLRRTVTYIPGELVLLPPDLRMNLDPFEEYDDSDLWGVLHEIGLKGEITNLTVPIHAGKIPFSASQRIKILLAAALLRDNKILILDNVLSHIEQGSVDSLNALIGQKFADCTIVRLTQRLQTIVEYDKVIVLVNGEITEVDYPYKLMNDQNSRFYSIALNAVGLTALIEYTALAKIVFQKKITSDVKESHVYSQLKPNRATKFFKKSTMSRGSLSSFSTSPFKSKRKTIIVDQYNANSFSNQTITSNTSVTSSDVSNIGKFFDS